MPIAPPSRCTTPGCPALTSTGSKCDEHKRKPWQRSGRGRPALYCSTGCRRAAEYEIRRLQATIERLEGKILHHREAIALDRSGCGLICCGLVPAQRRHLDVLTEQLAAAEQRFAVLLDDGGPTEDAG